jgi:NNP family nitrate/nitrite transporter-like MFS transporter
MNLFARALGGFYSDKINRIIGLQGRVRWLFAIVFAEGLSLIVFSRMTHLAPMLVSLVIFGLFVCMGCGATYAVVPFINRKAVGSVSGIVGAGGNAGAVAAGFLFTSSNWPKQFLTLGVAVMLVSFLALAVRFSPQESLAAASESQERERGLDVPAPAAA